MNRINILFAGTPEFAIPGLAYLLDNYNVIGILTKPDKPAGRGLKLKPPAVKEFAIKHNLKVFQPKKLKENIKLFNEINELKPDILISISYGKIFPSDFVKLFPYGGINFHPSLLPGYKGPSPIRWVLLNGEEITGVTAHTITENIDTGKIVARKKLTINLEWAYGELYNKLSKITAEIIKPAIKNCLSNQFIDAVDEYKVKNFYARKLTKEDFRINWKKESEQILNLIRASSPDIGAYTYYNNILIKIWKAKKINYEGKENPGTILEYDIKKGILIKTGDGAVRVVELQREGKKKLPAQEFVKGYKMRKGEVLQ